MMERLCTTRLECGFHIVTVGGEVDLSWSAELRRAILDAVGAAPAVLVELTAVSYIDSSGIAALVEGYQTARAGARQFGLLGISPPVRAVLELARLDQVFPIHDTLEAARG
jgi:anti-sigma B factor antagonist